MAQSRKNLPEVNEQYQTLPPTHGTFPTELVDNARLTRLMEPPNYSTCTNIPAFDGMTYAFPSLEANDKLRRRSRLRAVPRSFLHLGRPLKHSDLKERKDKACYRMLMSHAHPTSCAEIEIEIWKSELPSSRAELAMEPRLYHRHLDAAPLLHSLSPHPVSKPHIQIRISSRHTIPIAYGQPHQVTRTPPATPAHDADIFPHKGPQSYLTVTYQANKTSLSLASIRS
ncbi:hypothetical protein SNOG_12084 [Parastagonospora nodorum SN15]|uniref:Uncharacterized protein n=1 Tax=Phaeosphaeria nodorum (strain SN15 / ATCC MYA-4574 / FGSC 10173) TaxID=321614 RepID=Q0U830_PHANO|nr:hypothetical protein SNOG_12084 [Parastagonospora nodorum SN15]EAT80496.1 hypothetical protein SNOG_12084 [Parastagonospora nodorum SN15]